MILNNNNLIVTNIYNNNDLKFENIHSLSTRRKILELMLCKTCTLFMTTDISYSKLDDALPETIITIPTNKVTK